VTSANDAEGRVATAGAWSYTYDGLGNRVLKTAGGSTGSVYWYGADGVLSDETSVSLPSGVIQRDLYLDGRLIQAGFAARPNYFVLPDQIGSSRVTIDFRWNPSTGQYAPTYTDYFPFGHYVTQPTDSLEQKFTGKIRDNESGNDYFKYRYLASSMGRWLAPDPSGLSHVNLADPQQLNLYDYVGNNPLTRIDLEGLCWAGFQWACNLWNRAQNLFEGNGFHTDTYLALHPSKKMQEQRRESYMKETSANASQNRLLENSAYSLTAFHPLSVMTVVVDGVPIPIASLGISGTVTYIPKHNTWCIGGAVGIQTGAGKSLTATFYPSNDAAHTEAVVSDTGWNYNAQPTQFSGLSVNQNPSGTLMGYSVASDSGASGAYGYTKCVDF
jgi:RHS repeat-associated protein